ncbi:MAG: N-acetylneuraminate synthase family protein [Candidatus Brocadiales bacterium]|nr:N-acetylneuraminate synthase family protein [Candidatus Brocadiales bacterium]
MTKLEIIIANRKIGYEYNPLIIADIGINHGGSLDLAKHMVDTALEAGVEVIKHQTHIVDDEMSHEANKDKVDYIGKTIYELMDECALNEQEELELKQYVESKNAIFISTPFSRVAANRLAEFDVPAFKIGSGECNNYPLIEHICQFGKPIILSTGMNTINSVKKSVEIIEKHSIPYALLHTTNIYPTPPHLVRLGAMVELQNAFPKAVIGLSDHTTSNHACFGAVALGACILERHYTDTKEREGPDIKNSMDPITAKELIDGANIIKLERGGSKGPVDEEKPVIDFAYASVVSIQKIRKGERFTKKNIWVKRPGKGPFFARDYENILGKTAKRDIGNDRHIQLEDIDQLLDN